MKSIAIRQNLFGPRTKSSATRSAGKQLVYNRVIKPAVQILVSRGSIEAREAFKAVLNASAKAQTVRGEIAGEDATLGFCSWGWLLAVACCRCAGERNHCKKSFHLNLLRMLAACLARPGAAMGVKL